MDNTQAAPTPPRSVLIETSTASHDISQLVALTRLTEKGLQTLHDNTGTNRPFSYSAFIQDPTSRTGISNFKLENPDAEAMYKALKAAGRQLIFLRDTKEIAPAFPENGIPAAGQPYLIKVRDWTADDKTPPENKGFKSAATVALASGRKADIYFVAERAAFMPQNSVVLRDNPAP